MWIPSVPFEPLYRARVLPTAQPIFLSADRWHASFEVRIRIACVRACARIPTKFALSAHRSIDASFSPSVNVACLLQVARNFNWSGERDWSIGESAYVTTPSRFYLTRLESRIWNFDSSCNFRINFSFFLPQRGYEKINTFLSNAKRLAKVEVLLVVEFIRFKLCRAKGILGLFS